MTSRKRASACALVLLSIAVGGGVDALGSAFAAADVGQTAPALAVKELAGQTFDLNAMRGKVVIVNFWATWCLPCRQEMPILDDLYRRYHTDGLEMIGVSVDRPHDRAEVRKVMRSFSYPAAMLDEASANGFAPPRVLPITYVVDPNGIVRAEFTPDKTPLTARALADLVRPLLPRKPASLDSPDRAGFAAKEGS